MGKQRLSFVGGSFLPVYVATMIVVTSISGVAYDVAEHQDIATKARTNYLQYVADNPDTAVGAKALDMNWNNIYWAVEHEDDGALPRWHFWDPAGGPNNGIYGFDSALTRAGQLWSAMLVEYRDGNYGTAYENLGRIMHLISDMSVPAHVNLDDHSGIFDDDNVDWWESTYIPSHRLTCTELDSTSTTLFELMSAGEAIANDFDSGPADGGKGLLFDYGVDGEVDNGTRRSSGFTNNEGAEIAAVCYPAAIRESGGVLKLFYETIQPSVRLVSPGQGDITSGLNGVPFAAIANSYNASPGAYSRIHCVDFYYQRSDPPSAGYSPGGGYVYATRADSPDPADNYTFKVKWYNFYNVSRIWVRARAFDTGLCDSLPQSIWISIDSARPQILNKRP